PGPDAAVRPGTPGRPGAPGRVRGDADERLYRGDALGLVRRIAVTSGVFLAGQARRAGQVGCAPAAGPVAPEDATPGTERSAVRLRAGERQEHRPLGRRLGQPGPARGLLFGPHLVELKITPHLAETGVARVPEQRGPQGRPR